MTLTWMLIVWICCGSAAWALHPSKSSPSIAVEIAVFFVNVALGPIVLAMVIGQALRNTR